MIHLDHVALRLSPGDTLLVDALQDTWPSEDCVNLRTEEGADDDVVLLTGPPEVENRLLKRDLGRRDQDEEADPVKGAQVQVLCAGVGDGAHVGQELSGHCQLDGPNLLPLDKEFWKIDHQKERRSSCLCMSSFYSRL